MHQIDPMRLDLAREFKAKPLGPHSPDLQKLLKIMRWDPVAGRVVAVQPERDGPWCLARLTGPKGHPMEIFRQRTYATVMLAWWALFRRRWEDHTGQALVIDEGDRLDPLPRGHAGKPRLPRPPSNDRNRIVLGGGAARPVRSIELHVARLCLADDAHERAPGDPRQLE